MDDGEPLGCVLGEGDLPEAVEQALIGKSAGDELVIDLAPGEAFGPYDPEGLITVPRSQIAEDAEIVPGEWIIINVIDDEGGEESAEETEALVVEVSPDGLVLDLNHPLAEEPLQFRITVVKIAE
jgi:FKBP-type peptidyl-prolyl cis-trans isomerase 2